MTTTEDPLPDLIRALKHRTAFERAQAAKALGRLGWLAREAMPALMASLGDDDAKVREAAAQAVGQMGPEALAALCAMLTHDDKYVRRQAVWGMGKLGPLAKNALSHLCAALKDTDPRTATGAAQALGNMGAAGTDAVPALAEAMRGTNIVLCRLAAKALSQIGTPALPTLVAHLQHTDPFIRGESALALGWMGAQARSALPLLAEAIQVPASSGMEGKSSARTGSMTPATPPYITPPPAEATDPEDTARIYAAQALGRIGTAASEVLPQLRHAARHGSEGLCQAAQLAIRLIEGV